MGDAPPERPFWPSEMSDEERREIEETFWNAAACAAGLVIAMTAWDFSSHTEWTLGARHYWFGPTIRYGVRVSGLGIMAWIWWTAYRDEARRDAQRRELAGRAFVPGKTPGWEHDE